MIDRFFYFFYILCSFCDDDILYNTFSDYTKNKSLLSLHDSFHVWEEFFVKLKTLDFT